MKTNTTKKVIVSAMAIAMGAGIAGSISGTVAWYQYSTRATIEYQGAAAHSTESLLIATSENGDYGTSLPLNTLGNNVKPVTSGELNEDAVFSKLYKNPIYQYTSTNTWGEAGAADYISFDVWAKVKDLDGTDTAFLGNKPIYLTDVTIQAVSENGKIDLTNAIRVAVYNTNNQNAKVGATYSADGSAVDVFGPLDLNHDGKNDKNEKYSFETQGADLVYGDANKQAKSYATNVKAEDDQTWKIANDADPEDILGKPLASTGVNGEAVKVCTVAIYLEGWTKLNNVDPTKATFADLAARDAANELVDGGIYKVTDAREDPTQGEPEAKWFKYTAAGDDHWTEVNNPVSASSIWDVKEAVGAKFNVGLQFSTTVHENH